MKNFKFLNKFLWGASFLLLTVFSCEDIVTYNDGYDDQLTSTGAPVIDSITYMPGETAIETASLDEMIAIYGSNLSNVESVLFNDVEADLKLIYAVNSRIVLPVPREFPEVVTNKITLKTKLGSTETDFMVSIPQLQVTGLYNEFATAGDTVKILGKNFDLYDISEESGVVKINDSQVPILESSAEYLIVKIPEGTPDAAIISVSSPSVDVPREISFRDKGFQILNFEGTWGDTDLFKTDGSNTGDPVLPSGIDAMLRITGSFDAWSWNVPYGGGFNFSDQEMSDNMDDYYFKFEMLTKSNKSLAIGNLIINGYSWNPGAGGVAFNTYNKWKTMTFELTDIFSALVVGDWNGFNIVFQPSDAVEPDFSVCNMRIVKKL
ncbi:glycan-binding surface protein [Geofilum sp. OHC36d9]|uniref:glycan-binding surface protein n=1 Tax=Geofilum sp. OHC36d9 TaxID=3458413 RepID=UPI004033A9C4